MSANSRWRYVYGSVIGSSHQTLGTSCQDVSRVTEERTADGTLVLILLACDGAGSAARAEVGACVAQQTFWAEVCLHIRDNAGGVATITQAVAQEFVRRIRVQLAHEAAAEDKNLRDYATTFLAAVVDPAAAIFLQVGDGVIVRADESGYVAATWPQNGIYANTTCFVTDDDALDQLQFTLHPAPVDEIALLTDGLQNLALHFATRSVHAPFFASLFPTLRAEPPGLSASLTPQLEAWLASPAVVARTDDDKTIVLATRREFSPPES